MQISKNEWNKELPVDLELGVFDWKVQDSVGQKVHCLSTWSQFM